MNYVLEELPRRIEKSLNSLLSTRVTYSPDDISHVMVDAIAELDNSILRELLDILGPDLEETEETLSEIGKVVGGLAPDDPDTTKLLRCIRGSTILVSLVDSSGRNLWVASLGDCQAGQQYSKKSTHFTTLKLVPKLQCLAVRMHLGLGRRMC